MNNVISARLKELLAELGMTWQEFAEKANIPEETMRNIYYNRVQHSNITTLLSISKASGYTVNWLMGEPFMTPDEEAMLKNYRKCGKHGKGILQSVAKYEAHTAKKEREAKDKHMIPCIMAQTISCEGMKYNSNDTTQIFVTEPEAFLGLRVPNNNWSPKYCRGDVVLFANRHPVHGERALFMWEGNIYFRRYEEKEKGFALHCITDRHEPLKFKRMDELECLGTAIGVIHE